MGWPGLRVAATVSLIGVVASQGVYWLGIWFGLPEWQATCTGAVALACVWAQTWAHLCAGSRPSSG